MPAGAAGSAEVSARAPDAEPTEQPEEPGAVPAPARHCAGAEDVPASQAERATASFIVDGLESDPSAQPEVGGAGLRSISSEGRGPGPHADIGSVPRA